MNVGEVILAKIFVVVVVVIVVVFVVVVVVVVGFFLVKPKIIIKFITNRRLLIIVVVVVVVVVVVFKAINIKEVIIVNYSSFPFLVVVFDVIKDTINKLFHRILIIFFLLFLLSLLSLFFSPLPSFKINTFFIVFRIRIHKFPIVVVFVFGEGIMVIIILCFSITCGLLESANHLSKIRARNILKRGEKRRRERKEERRKRKRKRKKKRRKNEK